MTIVNFRIAVSSLDIKVTSNSPVLLGDSLVLNATVYDGNGVVKTGSRLCYSWSFRGQKKVKITGINSFRVSC